MGGDGVFWDRVACVYDVFANVINRKANRALCAAVEPWIEPGDEVLECACGTGLLSGVIAQRCGHLTATDFSAKMLRRAEKKYGKRSNIAFEQADILHLRYPDGAFDTVVAANVIHLLDEPLRALRELDRVCRPGGRIIIPTYMNGTESGRGLQARVHAGELPRLFRAGRVPRRAVYALPRPDPLRGGRAQKDGGEHMKVNTLDEGAIRDIGHAFGYYDYGAERGLIDLFPGRDAVASYICGYVRMALLGGMLHATSERGEGFIAFKRPGEKIGARAGLALLRALLGSMNGRALLRFARAMAKSGDGLDKRLDREKEPYLFVGLVCV